MTLDDLERRARQVKRITIIATVLLFVIAVLLFFILIDMSLPPR